MVTKVNQRKFKSPSKVWTCSIGAVHHDDVAQKHVIKISVTPSAKGVITAIAVKHDMKEIGVASRIYDWFTQQTDVVQKAILGMLPDGYEADIAKMALERIVAEGGKKRVR